MIWPPFDSKIKNVTGAAVILATSSIISGFLGIIRDSLLAQRFGSGNLDVYFAAFRIPDLVYNILIAGGITIAFLPLFSEHFVKDAKIAWQFTSNCLDILLVLLIFLCCILFFLTPLLVKVIVPGFSPEKINQTILLTRILFLSPILFGVSSIFSGILQYFNHFLIYSLCPILYNLGIILGILFFSHRFGILGVVFGVILGALFYLLIQIPPALNSGFSYQPIFKLKDSSIKKFFFLMIPRTLGISAQQINLVAMTAIASTLPLGSLAIFTFANNFQNFITGIIGTSFAIAVFPTLSKAWIEDNINTSNQNKKPSEFIRIFSSIFRQVFYLIIPASLLLFFLRNKIINVWLGHGQLTLNEVRLTATSVGLFCFSLFALSLIPLIFRAFFSLQDTRTPTLISISSLILNIFFSLYLTHLLNPARMTGFQNFLKTFFSLQDIENISVLGLPLAVSISTIFQFVLLLIFLRKRIGDFEIKEG